MLDHLEHQQRKSSLATDTKLIDINSPEFLPECANVSTQEVELALSALFITEEVLAGTTWICRELVLGTNTALTCLAPEVLNAVAEAEFEFGEFCLKENSAAVREALFELEKNTGDHLNMFVDVSINSRSSEDVLKNLQNVANLIKENLLPRLPMITSKSVLGLSLFDSVISQLNAIKAQVDSLLMNNQINQIKISQAGITASDIQLLAGEVNMDTDKLLQVTSHLSGLFGSNTNQSLLSIKKIKDVQVEYVLARPSSRAPLSFKLPESNGGSLEKVRELLINKSLQLNALGVNTSSAQQLLATGDDFYNQQSYKAAFEQYAAAYQSLQEVKF